MNLKNVFEKICENVRNYRDIKLVTKEKRRSELVTKPNYHATKYFSENLLGIEMKKTKVTIDKPIYLGMIVFDVTKTHMYEIWYDYFESKYGDRVKLCYTDTDSLMTYIKTEDFFEDIAPEVRIRFDTSSYHENDKRPLPIGMNQKKLGFF